MTFISITPIRDQPKTSNKFVTKNQINCFPFMMIYLELYMFTSVKLAFSVINIKSIQIQLEKYGNI